MNKRQIKIQIETLVHLAVDSARRARRLKQDHWLHGYYTGTSTTLFIAARFLKGFDTQARTVNSRRRAV